jgi:hypothetical protein
MPMSEDVLARLKAYSEFLAGKLRLSHWRIVLGKASDRKGVPMVECEIVDGRAVIGFWISPRFLQADQPTQRHHLVHELLHAHFVKAQQAMGALSETLPSHILTPIQRLHDISVEDAVDCMAELIAPGLPTMAEWEKQ